jgi:hypothetical protein
MNLQYIFGAGSAVLIAILVLQQLRFKKAHPGYLSLMAATADVQKKSDFAKTQLAEVEQETQHQRLTLEGLNREVTSKAVNLELLDRQNRQAQSVAKELEASTSEIRANYALAAERLKAVLNEVRTAEDSLSYVKKIADVKKVEIQDMEARSVYLLNLERKSEQLSHEIYSLDVAFSSAKSRNEKELRSIQFEISGIQSKRGQVEAALSDVMGKVDLYSRVDEYTQVGHFETPAYLYDTSVRYQIEITQIRAQQRDLIKDGEAVTYPEEFLLCSDKLMNRRILDGQINLMLFAFNVECDLLIEKVNPGNLDRSLAQIEKKAEQLERSAATMRCGFNIQYVQLKYEECKLQYEYKLKKQEEQEEQRLIREQMKEEVRVQKQYEDAMREAEKDELKYRRLIERAREQLDRETDQERALTLAKISLLEEDLKEALEKGQRAKSMAEQTRRGFVYVISNIGAFGEGVYKIGLTRRLDPQERVDELGGASVPFRFDVHAMCFSEDAPALESALHKHFSSRRVNAVNLRKEFFKVSLEQIQAAVEDMVGSDVDFKVMAQAEDYFESRRLIAA